MIPNALKDAWTTTYMGHKFRPFAPDPDTISITDIAWALSQICRFNGHITRFYSVAEHSVYVSHIVPPSAALLGLLHDAAEAYVGDMTSPIKECMPAFRALEDNVFTAISDKFLGNKTTVKDYVDVDAADKWIVYQEAKALLHADTLPLLAEWKRPPFFKPKLHVDFANAGLTSSAACSAFLSRFKELTRD